MAIQGMSQGLVFSNMSYYIHEQIPSITPCNTPPLSAQADIGVYNVTFNMGTATGCGVIVFEVSGDDSNPASYTIAQPLGDKASWDYGGNRNSEYSCCQMAQPMPGQNYSLDNNGTRYRLMGRGYARGFIGSPWQGFVAPNNFSQHAGSVFRIHSNAIGNEEFWGNNSTPLSPKHGSRLIPATGTVDTYTYQYVNNGQGKGVQASDFLSVSDSTRDILNEDQAASTDVSAPSTTAQSLVKNAMLNDGVYLMLKASNVPANTTAQNHINYGSAPSQEIQHGSFVAYNGTGAYSMSTSQTGLRVYNFLTPPGSFVLSNLTSPSGPASDDNLDYCGPYTGHHELEIKDPFRDLEYPGSSALTLDPGRFSTRQAMMCVPVNGGGNVKVRVEAPLKGTWANIKVFCPINLPLWGGSGTKCGIEKFYPTATLHPFCDIGITGGKIENAASSGATTIDVVDANGNNVPDIRINHVITGTNIAPGTIVTAINSNTLSLSKAITGAMSVGDDVDFQKSRLRQAFDDWNSLAAQNNTKSPTNTAHTTQFFNQLSKVVRIKPYDTEAEALAHDFSNPSSGAFKQAQNIAAHHVPSQNSIYRIQGNGNFRNPTGGPAVDNHGDHVLGGHGSRALAWNTLNSTNALAHHGIVNEGDWVFTRDNAARRARLPARGIIDMTVYANNDIGTVGGWYAYECAGNQYAVQVGSLDYDRGEVTVDAVSGTIPRNGVVRTVTT